MHCPQKVRHFLGVFLWGMYMFAIIDVYSRRIVGWSISNTMSMEWCRETLLDAIGTQGPPEIFNTDQGSQFTSPGFINPLLEKAYRSQWMGKEGLLTMFSSKDFGGRSNKSTCI